jgi:hypothetical protein
MLQLPFFEFPSLIIEEPFVGASLISESIKYVAYGVLSTEPVELP